MRVTLDATPLLGVRTGIGRYVHQLLDALASRDEVTSGTLELRATAWSARGARLVDLPTRVTQVGPRVPARLLRAAWTRTDHPRVETLVGRTDVVHGTNFVSPPTRRAREVVTIHDLTYEHLRDTVDADSLAYGTLVRRALGRGAHVVSPTRVVADAVRDEYGVSSGRVHVTPLGVDEAWHLASPRPDVARRAGADRPYLVFVGSLDPRKNLRRLVAAHARLRATDADAPDLVLAGPAGRADLAPSPGVHRSGRLSDADLRGLVAASAGLVLPSLDEGFGLPVVEALAAGRPVVAADLPVLHEVAGPYATFADPHDVDALADALARALAAPDDQPAQAARRAHAATFTWDACAAATLSAYRAALEDGA